MSKPVFSDGVLHVMPEKCTTCVFHPGNLMMLGAGRLKEIVTDKVEAGAALPCHKTTYGQREQQALCRGFVERYATKVPALRLAAAMGIIEEVEAG